MDCPNACEVKSYGVEMSYATLSSLSVQSLLTTDVLTLKTKYHKALEIRERVQTENLEQTVVGLQNVTNRLKVSVRSRYRKLMCVGQSWANVGLCWPMLTQQ